MSYVNTLSGRPTWPQMRPEHWKDEGEGLGCGHSFFLPTAHRIDCFLGVFAGPKKIPSGTYIGIYSGELLTDAESEMRGLFVSQDRLFTG